MELHAVIVNKDLKLTKAKKIAKDIINNDKRKFYRETTDSYRFRNIPKQKFVQTSFRSKPINKNVILVFGKLKK